MTDRTRVVEVAKSWKGTPFFWGACVKGPTGGVDCGRILGATLNEAGVASIDMESIKQPSGDWFAHRAGWLDADGNPTSYLDLLRRWAVEYDLPGAPDPEAKFRKAIPQPGDIVIAHYGRDWAHAAIVVAWPRVIAAVTRSVVTEWKSIYLSPAYQNRRWKYFDPFLKRAADAAHK